jgi:hypothetical protein
MAGLMARAMEEAALVPVHPHAGGHKRVDVRATSVAVAPSVAGDRAQDDARVGRGQGGMVETLALDHDVDAVGHSTDLVVVGDDAALAPLPDRSTPDRPVVTALDSDDVGAVVGQEHAGHRSGDTRRQLQHRDAVEDAGHELAASSMAAMMAPGDNG